MYYRFLLTVGLLPRFCVDVVVFEFVCFTCCDFVWVWLFRYVCLLAGLIYFTLYLFG